MLRPWGLLVLAIGGFFFATTLKWWILPLTLITYAALVLLSAKGTPIAPRQRSPLPHDLRVRRLPHGETRQMAQASLEAYGRVIVAIEGTDESTRTILSGAAPKLRGIFDALLAIAEARETLPQPSTRSKPRVQNPVDAEQWLRATGHELSEAPGTLRALRSEIVRTSIEGGAEAASRAASLEKSLDDWQRRLETLRDELPPSTAR